MKIHFWGHCIWKNQWIIVFSFCLKARAGFILNIIGILCINLGINTWGTAMFNLGTFPTWANGTNSTHTPWTPLHRILWFSENTEGKERGERKLIQKMVSSNAQKCQHAVLECVASVPSSAPYGAKASFFWDNISWPTFPLGTSTQLKLSRGNHLRLYDYLNLYGYILVLSNQSFAINRI